MEYRNNLGTNYINTVTQTNLGALESTSACVYLTDAITIVLPHLLELGGEALDDDPVVTHSQVLEHLPQCIQAQVGLDSVGAVQTVQAIGSHCATLQLLKFGHPRFTRVWVNCK